jgi:LysR family transcriptional regulator, low CO2-responsive transcriptional regulator
MLDLYKLQIFSVVVQEGSFSAAAERLYVTQSAISQHIKDLEANLGRQLFQRGWRGVKPTPHGEILHRYTEEIFALVARAENALTDVDKLATGRVSIGATPGIGVYLAPGWVQNFRARYPQLTVALNTGVTAQIVTDILGQRLDIGFIEGELDDHRSSRLSSLVLEEIEQHVVVGFKHPFWDAASLRIEDLEQQSLIVRETGSQSRIWLEEMLRRHDIDPSIGAEFDNLESIKRTVSLGSCITVLPPYVLESEVEQKLLRMIPIEGKPLTRSLKLIWASDRFFAPVTKAFLRELEKPYPSLRSLLIDERI